MLGIKLMQYVLKVTIWFHEGLHLNISICWYCSLFCMFSTQCIKTSFSIPKTVWQKGLYFSPILVLFLSVCIHVYIYIYIYVHIYINIYIYIYLYKYVHIYIYIYIHVYTQREKVRVWERNITPFAILF